MFRLLPLQIIDHLDLLPMFLIVCLAKILAVLGADSISDELFQFGHAFRNFLLDSCGDLDYVSFSFFSKKKLTSF